MAGAAADHPREEVFALGPRATGSANRLVEAGLGGFVDLVGDDRQVSLLGDDPLLGGAQAGAAAELLSVTFTLTDLSSTSRAGNQRQLLLDLSIQTPSAPTIFSINGMDWSSQTSTAIEVSWFGARNELGLMGSQVEIANPFEELARLRLPDEAVRPIARLLCQEILVRERGIARLDHFRLGRSISGRRPLALTWVEPARYANQSPASHSIKGTVSLP